MSESNIQSFPKSATPQSSPIGGNGGGYDKFSERITALEVRFEEVVKKSDLLDQTRTLEKAFRQDIDKVIDSQNNKWIKWIGIIIGVATLLIVTYSTFS